jgi:hypothetical protein
MGRSGTYGLAGAGLLALALVSCGSGRRAARGDARAWPALAAARTEPAAGSDPMGRIASVLSPIASAPAPLATDPPGACNEQPPLERLKRSTYVYRADASPEENAARNALHRAAVEYRTREYGFVEGFGEPSWNRLEPKHYAKTGKFFGIAVRMNNRVLDALGCVEQAIQRTCAATPYVPRVLDGLRAKNTFANDEVSNHLYGIAIDVDFDTNPCCGCVPPHSERPLCKRVVASPFERTNIPKCWVDTFERFGFWWLGHDELEDTMHFEFLGDPDRILRRDDEERPK